MLYDEYCFDKNLIPNDLKSLKNFYKQYREFTLELYLKIMGSEKAKQENPVNLVIGSSLKEIIELLDGIYILSNEFSTKNVILLVRKLFELYLQIAFILVKNDKKKKALIYILKNIQINKLTNWEDFCKKIEGAHNYLGINNNDVQKCIVLINETRTYNWFTVYNKKIKNLKDLSIELDKNENLFEQISNRSMYDKIYDSLSREAHGHASLNDIITINEKNMLVPCRSPINCSVNFLICTACMGLLSLLLIKYYLVDDIKIFNKCMNIYQSKNINMMSIADRTLKNNFYVELKKQEKVKKAPK
ncbi:DUF5677 domain-containing protein [Megamonas hypermegale]|uniref:DUF5677 domain-containing protein n=1 Tax=Megamonas hypermegale TaxID=158847 RepID=UPI0026F032F0|nr:DUF5677 domain-containing protein [Megamonas hypermegale]